VWVFPALTLALLPVSRDDPGPDAELQLPSPDVEVIDFDRLVEVFTQLLKNHWAGRRGHDDFTVYAAEIYLAGMLSWALKHQNSATDDAAAFLLNQILLPDRAV
jgi:hypothetical protein